MKLKIEMEVSVDMDIDETVLVIRAGNRGKSAEIIKDINKNGTTILLVEQNASMALSIAHRAYVLETGNIIISGTGEELAKSDEIQKSYLGGE